METVIDRISEYENAVLRRLDNGKTIYLIQMMFTWRLAVGWTVDEETGYDDFYCYHDLGLAKIAFLTWDGEGDPLDGWHRHGRSGRRRPEGDKAQEYINF